jgi:hypothetical protein
MPDKRDQRAEHGAAMTDAPERAAMMEDDGRETFTVTVEARHAVYLRARAAAHGRTPEQHLVDIMRVFRAHHDTARPDLPQRAQQPGDPPRTWRAD